MAVANRKTRWMLTAAIAILLIATLTPLMLRLRDGGMSAHAPGTPPNHLPPPFHAPMAGSANPFLDDPAQNARTTSNNLQMLLGIVMVYRGQHDQQLPRTLKECDNRDPSHPMLSPFDRSLGNLGYVYLPDNIIDRKDKVCIYDAAELAKTGSTHVIMSDTQEVRVMEKAQLAHQPGVTLP